MRVSYLLLGVLMTLAACNTFEGMGEDIESAGETLQDSAEETQYDMNR